MVEGSDDGASQGVDRLAACPESGPGSVGEGVVGNLEQADIYLSMVLGEGPAEGVGLGFELDTLLGRAENEPAYCFKEFFGCPGDDTV